MIREEKWKELCYGWSQHERLKVWLFYYAPGHGNGDWLYNTARAIIESGLKGVWEHKSLEIIFETLKKGQRWPDDAKEWIDPGLWPQQYRMTQDPWILAYCCAVYLGRYDLIEKYKPSIKVFNLPDKWAWRRALLGKPNLYWLWRRITPHNWMQGFVYVFYGFMDQAYKNA